MVNYSSKDENQQVKFEFKLLLPKIGILLIGIISILLIGFVDYLIVIDISLSICYLIPIALITKYLDRQSGIFLSLISACSWYFAEDTAKTDLNFVFLLWNTLVRLTVFLTVVYLLSTIKDAYKKEKSLAQIDSLTQIYNRRYFLKLLHSETKRSIRYQQCLTLVYFDIDNFKNINDKLGHIQGDRLLYLVACTVAKTIRKTDIFARLGGDEFVLLLPETIYQQAQLVLQRVQEQLNKMVKQESFEVSFSIGAITFLELPDSVDNMLERVDKLMYQVKHSGKNNIKHHLHGSVLP